LPFATLTASLTVAPAFAATLGTLALAPLIAALAALAIALTRRPAPARAALAALLLLISTLGRLRWGAFTTRRRAFRPCATATTPTAARTIARR
jgi:hypothetical protein